MFVLNVIGKGADPAMFADIGTGAARILSPGHAFDLPVPEAAALMLARSRAEKLPLDINLVGAEKRRRHLIRRRFKYERFRLST